jgi:integrase
VARLTTAECQKLVQTDALRKVPDGGGLYLFVKGRGRAYWTAQFRNGTSWSSRGFGSFPDVTPKMARDAFETWKVVERRAGVTAPAGKPRADSAAGAGKSFADAVQGWLAWKSADWRAGSRTAAQASAALGRLPFKTLAEIDTDAVLKALLPLPPRQRNDVRLWLMGALDWAFANKWTTFDQDGNPARFDGPRSMLWPKPPKRKDQEHMKALPWEELPKFYKSIPNTEVGNALRFLILTGSRTKELRLATWAQIKPDNGKGRGWEIPAENAKTDMPKFVSLVPEAMKLLGEQGAGDARLFKLGENTLRDLLRKLRDDVDVHGFRSTLADWAGDREYSMELREIALGHKVGDSVFQAYNHGDRRHLRRGMMEAFAKYATIC